MELHYYHLFSALFCSYTFIQSLQLYFLCSVPFTRSWLESFLGKEFLPQYLGDDFCARPFIILLLGLIMIFGLEFVSLYIGEIQNQLELVKLSEHFELIFGEKEDWDLGQKQKYCEITSQILSSNNLGVIRQIMTCLLK